MYTVDTSVWVNSFDQREPGHDISRQTLHLLATKAIPVIVPYLLLVEVAGAISRTRQDPAQAQAFTTALNRLPNVSFIVLDEALTQQAWNLAAKHSLRGADAVYAAVAIRAGSTLISLDNEHLTRLQGIAMARTPASLLPDLLKLQSS